MSHTRAVLCVRDLDDWSVLDVARYRTFKPELFADEKLTECSVDARFLFLGLFPFVDDMGRRQYHPRRIKAEVFPADDDITASIVDACVQELAKVGVVELYEVNNKRYLRIPHFLRHQNINRPSHCYVPPSPSEGPNAVKCACENCRIRRLSREPKNQLATKTDGNGLTESRSAHGVLSDNSLSTHFSSVVECSVVNPKTNTKTKTNGNTDDPVPHQTSQSYSQTNAENRRAKGTALDEITMRMLELLGITPKPLLIDAVSKSITTRAKLKNASYEAAGQQILARAALMATESPPEDWTLWFEDVRYTYVAKEDPRLKDARNWARAVCGGSRCTDGWETVRTGNGVISRRCPDCLQLWTDMGM